MSGPISDKDPIRFWFDFASPYAYFSLASIEAIGQEFGRPVEWRPILVWAVLKAHEIAPPMEVPARRDYLVNDMRRSAAFFGLPYLHPELPISSHLAARLFHAVAQEKPDQAKNLARRFFTAFFAEQVDIRDETQILRLAGETGIDKQWAQDAMKGGQGRTLLEREVAEAVASGVIGSPYFMVDGEGFFGADRLPQLRWYLSGGKT